MYYCLVAVVFLNGINKLAFAGDEWTKEPYSRKTTGQLQVVVSGPEQKNQHFWLTTPPNTSYQKLLHKPRFSVQPTDSYIDEHTGHEISYWDFTNREAVSIDVEFELEVSNFLSKIDPKQVGDYDKSSKVYQHFTKGDRLIFITPEILEFKKEIEDSLKGEANPYLIAKATFRWVLDHMAYTLLYQLEEKRDRGVNDLLSQPFQSGELRYYKGDCGSYSVLYNSILLAFGIPSRIVSGGWSVGKNQFHVWSEVLIPNYGWIPVDTSAADVFLYDEGEGRNKLGTKIFDDPVFEPIESEDFFFGNLEPFRYVLATESDLTMLPKQNWNFSEQLISWWYGEGKSWIMQMGIFHIFAEEEKVEISFTDTQ